MVHQEVHVLPLEEVWDADNHVRGKVPAREAGSLDHETQVWGLAHGSHSLQIQSIY